MAHTRDDFAFAHDLDDRGIFDCAGEADGILVILKTVLKAAINAAGGIERKKTISDHLILPELRASRLEHRL